MEKVRAEATSELLVQLAPYIEEEFIKPYDRSNCSPVQLRTIMALLFKTEPCSMTELAGELKISKQQMTPVIDKLIANGYVERIFNSHDRRIISVALTGRGQEFLEQQKSIIVSQLRTRISKLSENDLRVLYDSLKNIEGILKLI